MKKVLVVAVHPDDETLGCGGTLLRLKSEDCSIHWLIMTAMYSEENGQCITISSSGQKILWNNEVIVPLIFPIDRVQERSIELKKVFDTYGFDSIHELYLPTMCEDQVPLGQIIDQISNLMKSIQPDTIILPFQFDVHSDHRIGFQAAYSCTKSFRYPFLKTILMMETISETDFIPATCSNVFFPNLFVDISDTIEQKIRIMNFYKGELGKHPFPRSEEHIRALGIRRGASSNCQYAEGFVILKKIL